MDQGSSEGDSLCRTKVVKPATKYQTPTAKVLRGKKRHEAKTPKLKSNCHSAGNIQVSFGAARATTAVSSTPTTNAGRNCSAADWIISLAKP